MALFGAKTLDSIIGQFVKAKADLEAYSESARAESKSLYEQANELERQAYDKNLSADKADRIADNIGKNILD